MNQLARALVLSFSLALGVSACGGAAGAARRAMLLDVARKVRDGGCAAAAGVCRVADRVCSATGGPDVLGDDDLERVVDDTLDAE